MSFQSAEVKQVIRAYAVEIQTDSKKDLELDAVTLKLRKAMGANCECSLYTIGDNSEFWTSLKGVRRWKLSLEILVSTMNEWHANRKKLGEITNIDLLLTNVITDDRQTTNY